MAQTQPTTFAQCAAMLALLEGAQDAPAVAHELVRIRARLRGALAAANYAPDAWRTLLGEPAPAPAKPAPKAPSAPKAPAKPAPAPQAPDAPAKPAGLVKRKIRVNAALRALVGASLIAEAEMREVNRLAGKDIDAAEARVGALEAGVQAAGVAPAPSANGAVAPEFADIA